MNRVFAGYPLAAHPVRRQQAFSKSDFLRTKLIFKLLVLGAFVVFLSLFYIWSRVQIVATGYQINELKIRRGALLNENKSLKIELARLLAPERLSSAVAPGRNRKGMGLPPQDRIADLNEP